MLTGYQVTTVAFTLNGAIVCPDCAVVATSAITVAKAERGLSHGGGDLSAISRYGLDEYGYSEDDDGNEIERAVECEHCGDEIDS